MDLSRFSVSIWENQEIHPLGPRSGTSTKSMVLECWSCITHEMRFNESLSNSNDQIKSLSSVSRKTASLSSLPKDLIRLNLSDMASWVETANIAAMPLVSATISDSGLELTLIVEPDGELKVLPRYCVQSLFLR